MGVVVGIPDLVRSTGPGQLFVMPYAFGTAPTELPTTANPFPTDLREIGFTTGGSTQDMKNSRVDIPVAERVRPLKFKNGAASAMISFAMSQVGPKNLAFSMPGSTISKTTSGDTKVTLPKAYSNARYTIVWVSSDNLVMAVFTRCFISLTGALVSPEETKGDPQSLAVECAVEGTGALEDDAYWVFDSTLAIADGLT